MSSNVNPGYAFPLENLGSDIARNQFNYESILNGLIAWDKTTEDEVTIRLTMGTDPYYWDYRIPSKKSITNSSSFECTVEGEVHAESFGVDCRIVNTLYGGSRDILQSSFDAATVLPGTDEFVFDDVTGWNIGDELQLQKTDASDTFPTCVPVIQEGELYRIIGISGNNVTLETLGNTAIDITAADGSGIINSVKSEFNPTPSATDPGDVVTLRMSVTSSGGCEWNVNYIELVNDWVSGADYRWGNLVTYDGGGGTRLYRAVFDIENAQPSDTPDASINWQPWVVDWVSNVNYPVGTKVAYLGAIYTVIEPLVDLTITPDNNTAGYGLYAEAWVSGAAYDEGDYVVYDYMPYISKVDILNSPTAPDTNSDWFLAVTEHKYQHYQSLLM